MLAHAASVYFETEYSAPTQGSEHCNNELSTALLGAISSAWQVQKFDLQLQYNFKEACKPGVVQCENQPHLTVRHCPHWHAAFAIVPGMTVMMMMKKTKKMMMILILLLMWLAMR